MDCNRRVFLQSLGLGVAGFALSSFVPRIVRAEAGRRRFVFCYFSGGWDTLLCLDPRDPDVFTDDRSGETRIELGWDRIAGGSAYTLAQPSGSNIAFGPAMAGFARHHDVSCVVRGVSMDTLTHEVGRRYFLTGQFPRGLSANGASVPARIVAQQGDETPIPNLVSQVESYAAGLPPYAGGFVLSSVGDLNLVLRDLFGSPTGAVRGHLERYRSASAPCDAARLDRHGFLGLLRDAQIKARGLVDGNLDAHFQFTNASDPEMTGIRERYGIGGRVPLASGAAQAAMAFQAIKYGLAQSVSIEIAAGLDTHDQNWATQHPPALRAGFDALAVLVDDLKSTPSEDGGTLLDHTTLVVFSEFGRTPLLNNRDGRDHSLASSALLVGAGVPHNRVVGATSDTGMNPLSIDPITGEPVPAGGITLSPTLVLASVMESAGFDTSSLRATGLPCLLA